MRFWHTVEDSEGVIKEMHIHNDNKRRLSLECLEEILKGNYKITPTE